MGTLNKFRFWKQTNIEHRSTARLLPAKDSLVLETFSSTRLGTEQKFLRPSSLTLYVCLFPKVDNKMDKLKTILPDSPGVYLFKKGRVILYVGRATSLRDRVKSYFNREVINSRGPIIKRMVLLATTLSFKKADSVLEAVILESELIKRYQPKFNSREKDNNSFYYVVITKEKFPRVLQVRGRNLLTKSDNFKIKKRFGPFPSATLLKEALRMIRKLFPFRDRCVLNVDKPCFNFQIGLCPGVCTGVATEGDYKKQIKNIELFLSGKKKAVIRLLRKEMKDFARNQGFELAEKIKRKVFALEYIQDVGLIKSDCDIQKADGQMFRIEAYDVAHLSGSNTVGAMVVILNGEAVRGEYRKFKIHGDSGADDLRSLREVLERRLNHPEWRLPDLLIVDGGRLQLSVAKNVLKRRGLTIPVMGVVKDKHHKPKNILGDNKLVKKYSVPILLANSEAHNFAIKYFRKLANKIK